ncbi:unnamed protein product [Lupinus luteus]|uniref:Uncharacterized protein n=1 Tax=Lupinus luteus TaxID=3873 RepID=A0AAV1XA10_LUPLU
MAKPSMSLPSSRSRWKPYEASSKMNHQLHSPSSSFLHFDFSLISSFISPNLPNYSLQIQLQSLKFIFNRSNPLHSLKSLRIQLRSSKSPQFQLRLLKTALKVNELVVPVVSSTSTSNTKSISLSSKFEEMKVASRLQKFAFNDSKLATRNFRTEMRVFLVKVVLVVYSRGG